MIWWNPLEVESNTIFRNHSPTIGKPNGQGMICPFLKYGFNSIKIIYLESSTQASKGKRNI